MNDILLQGIIGVATAALGWIVGRRQSNAQAANTELDATEKAVAIWRSLAQDLKKEVDDFRELVLELRKEVDDLSRENMKLRHEIDGLKATKQKTDG